MGSILVLLFYTIYYSYICYNYSSTRPHTRTRLVQTLWQGGQGREGGGTEGWVHRVMEVVLIGCMLGTDYFLRTPTSLVFT